MTISKKSFSKLLISSLLASSVYVMPAKVDAAAFYIQEQSVSALGTASAGSAVLAEDASTIFFNPAGMTQLKGTQIMIGAHALRPSADTTDLGSTATNGFGTTGTGTNDGGNPFDVEAIPNAYFAFPVTQDNKLWFGLGISAPFGLANDYGSTWLGRYDSIESELKTIDIAPSVAYAPLDWLSIGGGVNVQYADAKLISAIPSPLTAGGPSVTTDGLQDLSGDAVTAGFNVGVLVKPMDGTKIGAHYRSGISHELEGRVVITAPVDAGGATTVLGGNVGLDLPDVATLSASQKINDKLEVLASVSWIGWSNFDSIPVEFDVGGGSTKTLNYENTNAFAVGARYQLNDKWLLRAGYQFDETPTNDQFRTTSIPDGDRQWFAAGASYDLDENWTVDFAGVYVDVSKETVNLTEVPIAGTSVTTNVATEGDVGILSVSATYRF